MAEIELGVLSRQCLDHRIPDPATHQRHITTGHTKLRQLRQVKVDWQFTTADARVKLKRLYPSFHDC